MEKIIITNDNQDFKLIAKSNELLAINLNIGETINGKIFHKRNDQVKMNIAGNIIEAKLEQNINIEAGQFITLKVVDIDKGKIIFKHLSSISSETNEQVSNEILQNISVKNTELNQKILDYLVKNNIELTQNNFNVINNVINKLPTKDERAILTALIANNIGLENSTEALKSIYNYLSNSSNYLKILDLTSTQLNELTLDDKEYETVLKQIRAIKESFQLADKPHALPKLVKAILTTPEQLLYQHISSKKHLIHLTENKIYQLNIILQNLYKLSHKQNAAPPIEKIEALKQILLGNIILSQTDLEMINNQVMIPFYYKESHCLLTFKRQKSKNHHKDNRKKSLTLVISHRKLGQIKFNIDIWDHHIKSNITVSNSEAKMLIEKKTDDLIKKIDMLGYKLVVESVKVMSQSQSAPITDSERFGLIKVYNFDIKV